MPRLLNTGEFAPLLRDGFVTVLVADGEADGRIGSDGLTECAVSVDQEILVAIFHQK